MQRIVLTTCLAISVAAPAFAERVIIKCRQSCDPVATAVRKDGGTVVQQFKYTKALVAEVKDLTLSNTRAITDAGSVRKDLVVSAIAPPRDLHGGGSLATEDGAEVAGIIDASVMASPDNRAADYTINNIETNVRPLHVAGFTGSGMKVAVIDTGIRPGFPHISLDGSVIGGEDFVGDGNGFQNSANNGHGTFVAGMISANVVFNLAPTSSFLRGIKAECPSCVGPAATQVAMVGSAPSSSIYSVRVLDPTGSGRSSWIIAGMERVIDLRKAFDAGQPETQKPDGSFTALNVKVANMSLGGETLFAGHDIEDELTNAFLDADIVLVVAAGNDGPSGATVASPGSGFGALTVAAASDAVHERILRNIQFNIPGNLYRPFDGIMTAFFSSRGPNADGRPDPDISANGLACFGQGDGTTGTIEIGSGTSFASPTISGIAAVLRQAVPSATARQVRNALILSANPAAITDGSTEQDRGAGLVDAVAARGVLDAMAAPDTPGAAGANNKKVENNIRKLSGIPTFEGPVARTFSGVLAGGRFETFFKVPEDTASVIVTLDNVTTAPPDQQNVFFGDDILLTVHSAKTSAIGATGDYKVNELTLGGTFTIANPSTGLMRVTVNGDSTNKSPVGGVIKIVAIPTLESGKHTNKDKIADGESRTVTFTVPPGTARLDVKAEWDGNWGAFPTNDIDVVLQGPDGKVNTDAATDESPERATIKNPLPGTWTATVIGFSVNTGIDDVRLRVLADGEVLREGNKGKQK